MSDSHGKRLDTLNHRLESVANHLEASAGKSNTGRPNAPSDNLPVLRDYDSIIQGTFATFGTLSRKIGGELPTMIDHLTRLFNAQKDFIRHATQHAKPSNNEQTADLVKPQSKEIEAICGKSKRGSAVYVYELVLLILLSLYR